MLKPRASILLLERAWLRHPSMHSFSRSSMSWFPSASPRSFSARSQVSSSADSTVGLSGFSAAWSDLILGRRHIQPVRPPTRRTAPSATASWLLGRREKALRPEKHFGAAQVIRPVAARARCSHATHLTMRWSERRTAVRPTFEITSALPLRATRALVRRRSSCSR